MSCLTTTEKAKAIAGCLIYELNKIKMGKGKTQEVWLGIIMIMKSFEDNELVNIGLMGVIAEWYNKFNKDTKEQQALLLHILSYYYELLKDNGGFCLDCPHCKPLKEKGIHKKSLIKDWIKQVRHEKCACGNALIWEAFTSRTGLDEDYYRTLWKPAVGERINEAFTLLDKGIKYLIEKVKDE